MPLVLKLGSNCFFQRLFKARSNAINNSFARSIAALGQILGSSTVHKRRGVVKTMGAMGVATGAMVGLTQILLINLFTCTSQTEDNLLIPTSRPLF